jgi:LCP family protein required for cell wall assembly
MANDLRQRPYKVYRSGSRGLKALFRSDDEELGAPPRSPAGGGPAPAYTRYRSGRGGGDGRVPGGGSKGAAGGGSRRFFRRPLTLKRGILYVLIAIFGWVLLSFVLFLISAQTRTGSLPDGAQSQLTGGGPMLTSANTILVLGLDTRPTTGPGSKEGGANHNDAHAATDTIMLWRLGGGVSRRLSIPRDTLVNIPGAGQQKINAAWAIGGPALALKTIKQFTGLQINHLVVINLANFPKFIDDIGGVDVTTGRVCSTISGGTKDGGFSLNLYPGTHHLNGLQAETLARTRENSCNPASNDLTREAMQQQILNSIKSQLFTFHTFLHLPWAAWDAPSVIETDMGGLTLMQMFIASEIGGSAPVNLLSETPQVYNGADVLVPNQANVHAEVQKLLTG